MIDDSTDGDPIEEIADAWAKVYIDVAEKLDQPETEPNDSNSHVEPQEASPDEPA
ncbi:MAG TPA: hypothetical protein PKD64_19550 [Pirellulaceae bacterium]|nr:hypothetical protein [Pirellulaceae bacterium]